MTSCVDMLERNSVFKLHQLKKPFCLPSFINKDLKTQGQTEVWSTPDLFVVNSRFNFRSSDIQTNDLRHISVNFTSKLFVSFIPSIHTIFIFLSEC